MIPGVRPTINVKGLVASRFAEIDTESGEGLAVIMMEPLQGEGGIQPSDETLFFGRVRQLRMP